MKKYVPHAVRPEDWEPVADFTRAVVLDVHPEQARAAIEAMRTTSQFVVWAHRQGLPLDREAIFTPDVVERYIAIGCPNLVESSRATRRSDLRRFSVQVTKKAPWRPAPPRLRGDYAVIPYTPDQVSRMLEVASQQRTPVRRRRLTAVLALGLGTGTYPREIWQLTTENLVERHGHLCLAVPGANARIVPVTPPHDQTLARIRAEDPGSTLLGFAAREWDRSRLWHMIEHAELPPDCPPIKLSNLRATWILGHLINRVHLNGLARMAGVSSWKTFGHLMAYMPPIDERALVEELTRR
ncbi:hypothetical protein GCM10025864_15130 [Luteimicrobium album]|uniref:Tyr recombinase domain-containing protein n=1 Tax=Luteimicrobium album TaxID=1054550 RepID=A0ABQ6HZ36_9MICO|nr:site-specific integrase [Luteimicrobium album]GMA23754.1 hypothetical protein GCM10025864_15130 [Luteimicrobium album]